MSEAAAWRNFWTPGQRKVKINMDQLWNRGWNWWNFLVSQKASKATKKNRLKLVIRSSPWDDPVPRQIPAYGSGVAHLQWRVQWHGQTFSATSRWPKKFSLRWGGSCATWLLGKDALRTIRLDANLKIMFMGQGLPKFMLFSGRRPRELSRVGNMGVPMIYHTIKTKT